MSGETQTPSKPHSGFEETVKDFWASRPRRPLADRKIAGVAAAIGNRYAIDPVVVRVALIATTIFGGAGLVLYVLGWLFFPDERDQVSAFEGMIGRGRSSTSNRFTVLLCIALIPLSSWTLGGGWFSAGWFEGGGVIGLALLAAALYLLHRNRGQHNRPVAPVEQAQAFGPDGFDAAFSMADTTPATDSSAPAGWDPLGAAPLAWDLPDPHPAPAPTPGPGLASPTRPPRPVARRNKKVGVVTFWIALLIAGVGVALHVNGEGWFSVQHIIGVTLGVLGIGMVVGAFVRGGRGLIALAVPLAIAGMALTAVPFTDFRGGFGALDVTPTSVAEVMPVYQRSAGDIHLDLRRLPTAAVVSTSVNNGGGISTVIVPETADVRFDCEVGIGEVDCLNHRIAGFHPAPTTGEDLGADGRGGPQITLNVKNATGNVEVRRG